MSLHGKCHLKLVTVEESVVPGTNSCDPGTQQGVCVILLEATVNNGEYHGKYKSFQILYIFYVDNSCQNRLQFKRNFL